MVQETNCPAADQQGEPSPVSTREPLPGPRASVNPGARLRSHAAPGWRPRWGLPPGSSGDTAAAPVPGLVSAPSLPVRNRCARPGERRAEGPRAACWCGTGDLTAQGRVHTPARRVAACRSGERGGEDCPGRALDSGGRATAPVRAGGRRPRGGGRRGEVGVGVVQRQGCLGVRGGEGQQDPGEVEVVAAGQQDQPAGECGEGAGTGGTRGHGGEGPAVKATAAMQALGRSFPEKGFPGIDSDFQG
jgi:hypothetical protein